MPASIFMRARHAFAVNLELGLSGAEQRSQARMARYSVREVEQAEEDARDQRFSAERRRDAAERREAELAKEIAEWGEKADYSLSKDREDLARAALARQVDLEREQARQGETKAQAKREMKRLQALGEALSQRREEMAEQLRAAKIDRGSAFASDDGAGRDTIEQAVAKAEQRFARIMDDLTRDPPASSDDKAAFAEIDAIRREDAVAQRLAAIKSGAAKAKAGKKKR